MTVYPTLGSMNPQERLESWKEIGAYLQRDATTARRWEKEEGLPVHRHSHKARSSVYAYPSEIDAWRAGRKVAAEPAPVKVFWRWPALAATMLLCLVMVGNGTRPVAAQQRSQQARRVWANALGGGADEISRDGRSIVFVDWDSGNLAARDLQSGAVRFLTNSAGWKETYPGYVERGTVISPDGNQVALSWWDYKTGHGDLRVVPFHGAGPSAGAIIRQNSEDAAIWPFGWSPDGKEIFVERRLVDQTNQLAAISVRDGNLRPLKSLGWLAAQARVSPDGRYIAYDRPAGHGAPSSDIVVLASDGSQENVIVNHPAKDFSPMWTPDGNRVLFLSDRTGRTSLWSIRVQDGKAQGEPKMIKAEAGQMLPLGITHDGTLYHMLAGGTRNIQLAELDAGLKVSKPPVPAVERFLNYNFHPSWSPNGEFLAYYSEREGAYQRPLGPMAPEGTTVLVIRSTKTGEEREIRLPLQVPAYPVVAEPKWFPDGRSILVTGWTSERPGLGYFRVDVPGGKTELLHRPQGPQATGLSPARMDLAPDGRFVYYVDGGLRRFDIQKGEDIEIRKIPLGAAQIAISPDGKLLALAYRSGSSTGDSISVHTMPVDGGEPRLLFTLRKGLTDDTFMNTLTWSRDQRYLLIAQPDKDEVALWKISVSGGEPEKLGLSTKGVFKTPRIDPDGRKIAYEVIESAGDEIWALENFLPSRGN